MTDNINFAVERRPTFRERFWRTLGFRYHLVDLPDETVLMPGWAMTHIVMQFDLCDRLRLLLTGRLHLDVRHAMSAEVERVISATSFRIAAPGDRPHD